MSLRFAVIGGFIFFGGCAYHVAEQTDQVVADMARKTFDKEPPAPAKTVEAPDKSKDTNTQSVAKDVQTVGYLNAPPAPEAKVNLDLPPGLPGREVPPIKAATPEDAKKLAETLYPPLPPLPEELKFVPRPEGPYTLSELQTIAALNSPALKQAASDVKAAEGALQQARAYANPTFGVTWQPSNDGSTAGWQGVNFGQSISTWGKMDIGIASAKQDLKNAELALKRARSDLSTQVRTAYFGLLVAKETDRVNRALAVLTDEVYFTQVKLLKAGQAASYEPATLRAQAYQARLALQQGITNYDFAWKQVVSSIGLRQLPLTEVAGRVDAYIPYFDYDRVLAHVLQNHTDVLTVRNGMDKAKYQLKLAQLVPYSDVSLQLSVGKDTSLYPFQWCAAGSVSWTLPVWDQNRGNIMSAEAALVRAVEQPHATELTISNNLLNAYNNYKNALDGLEYYRRFILPDQVRYYRGVLARRNLDINAQFGDLVQAQQTLASNVASYLTILSQIWTASVSVADFLQTDDMFELAKPQAIPALPNMSQLPPLPDCHQNQVSTAPGTCPPMVGPARLPAVETKP